MKKEIPFWEKSNLTLDEAAAYTNIGINKLRELSNSVEGLCLMVGTKRLLKKSALDEYLNSVNWV